MMVALRLIGPKRSTMRQPQEEAQDLKYVTDTVSERERERERAMMRSGNWFLATTG